MSSAAVATDTVYLDREMPRSKRLVVVYLLLIGCWVLDFKGESGGVTTVIQSASLLGYCLLYCYMLAILPRPSNEMVSSWLLRWTGTWFVALSTTIGLLSGQNAYTIFTNAMPLLLFVSAYYATYMVVCENTDCNLLERGLKWLCLAFVLSTPIIRFIGYGLAALTLRFMLLGASTVAAIGLLSVIMRYRGTKLDVTNIVTAAIVILLAITRTLLVILLVQFLVLHLPALWRGLMDLKNVKVGRQLKNFAILLAFFPFVLLLDAAFGGAFIYQWVFKLFASDIYGIDPSYYTRIAEANFMRNAFFGSISNFLLGAGLAGETSLTGDSATSLTFFLGFDFVDTFHGYGFGHHLYWSIFFIGGLLGGLPFFAMLMWTGWMGLVFSIKRTIADYDYPQTFALGLWGVVIVIGFLANGLLSSPLGNRGSAVWFGIGCGLLIGCQKLFKSKDAEGQSQSVAP